MAWWHVSGGGEKSQMQERTRFNYTTELHLCQQESAKYGVDESGPNKHICVFSIMCTIIFHPAKKAAMNQAKDLRAGHGEPAQVEANDVEHKEPISKTAQQHVLGQVTSQPPTHTKPLDSDFTHSSPVN